MSTILVRFSSLGDVVLAAGVTRGLGEVVFVTRQPLAGLVRRFPGVVEVIAPGAGEGLAALRRRLPPGLPAVDLQASPASRALLWGRPTRRVRPLRVQRHLRVAFKWPPRVPAVVARYAEAAGVEVGPRPWIDLGPGGAALALAPGAAHATKRWPAARYAALGARWPGPVVVLGSEGERALLEAVAAPSGAEVVAERGFERTLDALSRAAVLVGGDTGLMHLAAAAGRRVVALFGPTHPDDGFWAHPGEALGVELPCRPCSRFGGARCPMGDHLCMEALDEARVWAALEGR